MTSASGSKGTRAAAIFTTTATSALKRKNARNEKKMPFFRSCPLWAKRHHLLVPTTTRSSRRAYAEMSAPAATAAPEVGAGDGANPPAADATTAAYAPPVAPTAAAAGVPEGDGGRSDKEKARTAEQVLEDERKATDEIETLGRSTSARSFLKRDEKRPKHGEINARATGVWLWCVSEVH